MERVFLAAVLVLAATILAAMYFERARPVAKTAIAVLIYVPSYFAWWALQYLHVVPVDAFLARTLGVEAHQLVGTPLGSAVLFGPPLLPPISLLCWYFVTRKRTVEPIQS